MALINRRRWITLVIVSGLALFWTMMYRIYSTQSTNTPKSVLRIVVGGGDGFLDPQRNLPEKSKLYDVDVSCDQADYKDTPFLKHLRDNDSVVIPEIAVLETLSGEELSALYHTYVETVQQFCRRVLKLGHLVDGGWDVCHDKGLRPTTPCLVYSFGINNDFSFDDAVIAEYGCVVHSFDPSMAEQSYKRNKNNYFHNLGLSSENMVTPEGWQINTLSKIRQDLGHSKEKISILKMDIELWEWDVLPDFITSGNLKDVDALFVEFHLNLIAPATESGRATYLRAMRILKQLYDLDFRIFYSHRNPSLIFKSTCRGIERANCHEVNFIKVKKEQ